MSESGASREPKSRQAGAQRASIPRAARTLRQRVDFEAVLRSGSRFSSRNFVLRAYLNACSHARLGIIAGKKVATRAVDRNRARRLIREAFRGALSRLGPYDLTVQLRSDLRSESNTRVRAELDKLLESVARLEPPESQPIRQ